MDEDDSDSEILVIDQDEEPKEAGLLNNGQSNKILTNEEFEQNQYHNKHHGVTSASKSHDFKTQCNFKDNEKEKKEDDHRGSTETECLEHRHVHNVKRRLIRGTSKGSDIASKHDKRYPDAETFRRVPTNMDINILEIGDHVRHRMEDNQAEERGYMDDYIRKLNINTYRPWITNGHEVTPIAYGIQGPDAYKARINAYRPEEALNIEDRRHVTMNSVYSNKLRTEHTLYTDEYGNSKINMETYSHDHISDDPKSIDYRHAMSRYAYDHAQIPDVPLSKDKYRHIYRPEQCISVDDYRHPVLNMDPYMNDYRPEYISIDDYGYATTYNSAMYIHRPEVAMAIDEFNQAVMSRHAYDFYRRQAAMDPFRLGPELAHFHRPDVNSVDTGRLGLELHKSMNYPVPDAFIHSSQGTQNTCHRFDRSGNINIGREEALNLVRKRQAPYNESQENLEPFVSYKKKYGIQTSITNQSKLNYEQLSTIADTTHTHRNIHQIARNSIVNNQAILSKNNRPEDTVHINACEPISVQKYRPDPDTVILNTKTLNMPTQIEVSVQINKTNNVSDHNSGKCTLDQPGVRTKDGILCTNAEKGEVMHKNDNHKDNATVDETVCKSNQFEREVDDLARGNNVKFLVVFFTRVKELVKETFPEFAKSLQREIETLGTVSVDGKVKTDIQYICPLYCSVSTYSLPRFHNMTDDNKIEKHVNRIEICDVCSCIQNCYKLYKKKYYDQLLKHLLRNGRAKEKDRTTSVIKSVGLCKSKPENITQSGIETDGNTAREEDINKESVTDLVHSNIEQGTSSNASLSALETIDTRDLASKITDSMLKLNVEKTIFEELSTLTFNLPTNNVKNALIAPKTPSSSYYGKQETLTNNSLKIINQATPKLHQNINVNKNNSEDNNSIRNPVKDEPNLIFSLSLNDINNADIIASKLKNKIGRKPDSVFTCHICTCIFTYYTSFVSHLQKEHNINDIDEEIPDGCIARKCPFCGYYSKQKYHNDHVKRAHPEMYAHKGDISKIKMKKVDKRKKSNKRKFVFICLVCDEKLMSYEVNEHREAKHKGMNIPKMFTKRLLSNGLG